MQIAVAILLLALFLFAPARGTAPPPTRPETVADSLYDAQAIDSLLAHTQRWIARAAARGDSVLAGRMIHHRGRARLALRDPAAAGDFDLAIAIATAAGDSVGRMHALGLKSFVAVNAGRIDESIALNEERNRIARALGQRGSEAWGHLLIGYALLYRGDDPATLTRARAEYEEAWRAFGDVERPRLQLMALVGLGRVFDRMGRYDEARRSYQHAWLTARELGDRSQEADAINNLGNLELEHGELAQAARYYERAYRLKRETGAFDIAGVASNVASTDIMIGRYAHAESTLAEAVAMGSANEMLRATAKIEMGRLRVAQGRVDGAASLFRELLLPGRGTSPRHRLEAVTYLSDALARADSVEAAVALMDGAFPGLARMEPSVMRAEAFLEWSRRLRETGAIERARGAAEAAWNDASARRDSTLATLAAAEVSRCEHARGDEGAARAWLDRARALFERPPGTEEYQWREARRAVLAGALVAAADVLRTAPAGGTEESRHRALFDFLQQVQGRTLMERVTDPRRYGEIAADLTRPMTVSELQRDALAPGECYFDATVGEGRIYVFGVTRDAMRAAVIEDARGAFERRTRNYARLLARAPVDARAPAPDAASAALGRELLGGVADMLRSSPRVYATLDGYLAALPLETLLCPGDDAPMGVEREIVRMLSAAMLRYLRARPAPPGSGADLLAVGSGAGDLAGAAREVRHLRSRYGAATAVGVDRAAFLDALAGCEIIHVATHVRVDSERPWHSGILVEAADSTAGSGRSRTRGRADQDPLALTPAESSAIEAITPRDPWVRASEIAARRIDAELVVLSGCESALGRATLAEGVLGVASAFVSAGGRAVVASLWEVDDQTTADLMGRFYRELAAGRSVVGALQAAQAGLRTRKPHPFFWAGFVVIGDGDVTVALAQRRVPGPGLIAALAGVLTLAGIGTWVFARRRAKIAA